MSQVWKILVVVILLAAIVTVVALKQKNKSESRIVLAEDRPGAVSTVLEKPVTTTEKANQSQALPRLVDLGAGTCIPCKMMAPILEELKTEYAGQLNVGYLDVRQDPNVISEYHIRVIPTQIFFDASGQERFRHEGFMSKEDILAKWEQLGVRFSPKE
jgi:thioredoxin 1